MFKPDTQALGEYIGDLLKPLYAAKRLSKDQFKAVARRAAEKVDSCSDTTLRQSYALLCESRVKAKSPAPDRAALYGLLVCVNRSCRTKYSVCLKVAEASAA